MQSHQIYGFFLSSHGSFPIERILGCASHIVDGDIPLVRLMEYPLVYIYIYIHVCIYGMTY